jgi:hypothetical protein
MVDRSEHESLSRTVFPLPGASDSSHGRKRNKVSICCSSIFRIAIDPIFPPPPVPNSKKHQIPDALDNKFELVFNERDDAAELKNLPIGKCQLT